jgi:tRNA(fMet)-specific endonuclease VapC
VIPVDSLIFLDTNILVEVIRNNAVGQHVISTYGLRERAEKPLISVVTLGEIKSLARQFGWGQPKIDKLDSLLQELVVVPIEKREIIDKYSEIDFFSQREAGSSRNMGKNDLWIAASVSVTKSTLLTTDGDFDHLKDIHIKLEKVVYLPS